MERHRVRPWLSSPTARLVSTIAAFAALVGAGSQAGVSQPPPIHFDGCTAVRRIGSEQICLVKPQSQLTLWVESTACEALYVTESGAAIDFVGQRIDDGCQIPVQTGGSRDVTQLEVHSAKTADTWFRLTIDRSKPTFLWRTARMHARAIPDVENLEHTIQQKINQSTSGEDILDVLSEAAVASLRKGQAEQALRYYRQLSEHARSHSYITLAIEAAARQAQILSENGLTEQAKAILAESSKLLYPGDAQSFMLLSIQNGFAATMEEQSSVAVKYYSDSLRIAQGVGNQAQMGHLAALLIPSLVDAGNFKKARSLLPLLEKRADVNEPCEKAKSLFNLAAIGMDLAELEGLPPGGMLMIGSRPIRDILNESLQARQKCMSNPALVRLYVFMTRAALMEGHLSDARTFIDLCRAVPGLSSMAWFHLSITDYESQWSIRSGQPKSALQVIEDGEKLLERYANERQEFKCRFAIGRMESLRLLKQVNDGALLEVRKCLPLLQDGDAALNENLLRRASAVLRD